MPEQIYEVIMNLRDEVLTFASHKNHTHNQNDIDGMTDLMSLINSKAPKNHSDSTNQYGEATTEQYGHVKLTDEILGTGNGVPTETAVKNYIDAKTAGLDPSSLNIPTDNHIRDLATSVLNNTLTNDFFNSKLTQKTAIYPKDTTSAPNSITTIGYYRLTGTGNITYGNQSYSYHNAFLRVTYNGSRYIQLIQLNNSVEFMRTRYKKTDGTWAWSYWHMHYMPYTENASVVKKASDNNEYQNISVYETTAGYIIRWKRSGNFTLTVSQYNYDKICGFSPALNITGPFIFGNLVGKSDVRITSTEMQIRSTDQKGQYISGINETFFVPRKI